jgi:meso-butanediol dehydrogenase/(S,S)-butanediol dehydrogenase/diacetyl reductase
MMRIVDKVALVTGGRSGIGQATARRLRNEGATVVTAQRGIDLEFSSISVDFADTNAASAVVDQVIATHGQLDVLINNAGIMQEAYAEDMSLDDWMRTLNVNLTAPFLLIKSALPHLRKTKGAIVNTGSIEGLGSNPMHAAYGASKAGLHGLTKAIAVDHGKDGIRCNAVAPGWIDTDLNVAYIDNMPDPDAFRRDISKIHPIGSTGKPQDVAGLIAFLASDDAAFITGEIYRVDGGRMSKLSLPQ